MLERGEKVRERTITTMAERRREIGEQMNWTISLRARAEGQALCKTEKRMWGRRAWDREGGWGKSGGAERRKDGGVLVSDGGSLEKKNDCIIFSAKFGAGLP